MEERVDIHVGGYHLTEPIGTGGMGSVFKAVVEVDGKAVPRGSTVAVKLLHPHLRTIGEFVKRFHREARLVQTGRLQEYVYLTIFLTAFWILSRLLISKFRRTYVVS